MRAGAVPRARPPWYASQLSVQRVINRTWRNLKARVTQWFIERVNSYFPERTGDLKTSYVDAFLAGLANDQFVVGSDLHYAPYVEAMGPGTRWTYPFTRPQAATRTFIGMQQILPMMLQQSFDEAVQFETGTQWRRY